MIQKRFSEIIDLLYFTNSAILYVYISFLTVRREIDLNTASSLYLEIYEPPCYEYFLLAILLLTFMFDHFSSVIR